MAYLTWAEKTINDFSDANIDSPYNEGYLFTREGRGKMYQTRSLRIDLSKFELSSENRRVLRKTENIKLEKLTLPLSAADDSLFLLGEGRGMGYIAYHWSIGKLGKDFYTEKFGDGTFSANKIKELMTDKEKSNFNTLFTYSIVIPTTHSLRSVQAPEESLSQLPNGQRSLVGREASLGMTAKETVGYAICLETNEIIHYCYPFYELSNVNGQLSNVGLGMMLKAIVWAKENNKKYIYLGSFQRPTDTYKLQFEGLEWFDGKKWKNDLDKLKKHAK